MLKIAHRGNTNGPSWKENQPIYIQDAIDAGFDAEIDIRVINGKIWAGHDNPQYLIQEEFLAKNREHLWIHCKNLEALNYFRSKLLPYMYFWHEGDAHTITSNGFIWTYPGKEVGPWSIIVDVESSSSRNCYAVCSDYMEK